MEPLPPTLEQAVEVGYRSTGLGIWGIGLRSLGMPLEKIAMTANSSQVSGRGQMGQAFRLVFKDGWLAPYKVITSRSMVAWFFQYSIMGFAFQLADRALSRAFCVDELVYGDELFKPKPPPRNDLSATDRAKAAVKTALAPICAGSFESLVSNKAEVQRFYGLQQFDRVEKMVSKNSGILQRAAGQAFAVSCARNSVMSSSSFVFTPYLFMLTMPESHKDNTSLFWFGLGFNIFCGNVVGVTLQSFWGRSLDYIAREGRVDYRVVVREGLRQDGVAAFLTPTKWFAPS